jgi:hypothetical protein
MFIHELSTYEMTHLPPGLSIGACSSSTSISGTSIGATGKGIKSASVSKNLSMGSQVEVAARRSTIRKKFSSKQDKLRAQGDRFDLIKASSYKFEDKRKWSELLGKFLGHTLRHRLSKISSTIDVRAWQFPIWSALRKGRKTNKFCCTHSHGPAASAVIASGGTI